MLRLPTMTVTLGTKGQALKMGMWVVLGHFPQYLARCSLIEFIPVRRLPVKLSTPSAGDLTENVPNPRLPGSALIQFLISNDVSPSFFFFFIVVIIIGCICRAGTCPEVCIGCQRPLSARRMNDERCVLHHQTQMQNTHNIPPHARMLCESSDRLSVCLQHMSTVETITIKHRTETFYTVIASVVRSAAA